MIDTARTLMRGNPWAFQVWYEGLAEEEQAWVRINVLVGEQVIIALCEVWESLKEAVQAVVEAIIEFCIVIAGSLSRWVLYLELRSWHIPIWLALWLAQRCPRQWLPPPGVA